MSQQLCNLIKEYSGKLQKILDKLDTLRDRIAGTGLNDPHMVILENRWQAEISFLSDFMVGVNDLIRHVSQLLDHGPEDSLGSEYIELRVRLRELEAIRHRAKSMEPGGQL